MHKPDSGYTDLPALSPHLRRLRHEQRHPQRRPANGSGPLEVVLEELYRSWGVEGRVRVRFKEMDITAIKDDADFWQKMVKALIYTPEEARGLIEAGARR